MQNSMQKIPRKDIVFKPIVKLCQGCSRITGDYCKAYINPEYKWGQGFCNHNDISQDQLGESVKQRKMLNPIKASKKKGLGPMVPTRKYTHERKKNKGMSKKRYITGHLDVVPAKKGQ